MTDVLGSLEQTVRERREARPDGSYSAELFGDQERVVRKIMEEAFELSLELGRAPTVPQRVVEEAADLVFHVLVGLVSVDSPLTMCSQNSTGDGDERQNRRAFPWPTS